MHCSLQNIDVYTSDAISKSVSIFQNGKTVTASQESAYCHLQEQDEKLSIYIPQSKGRQQVCLLRELPLAFLKNLGPQT
jgi:hypothetical protein